MDLVSVAVRAAASYVFLLFLLRLAGKRAVKEGTTFDFVLALVLGDLVDDAVWADVPMAQFVIAAGTLVFLKLGLTAQRRFAERQ
jgi:uncharacterized membrane protein YcaP (DUF421 family)